MILVQKHADIPIPAFIKAEFHHECEYGDLWMDFIPGSALDVFWEKFNNRTKWRPAGILGAFSQRYEIFRSPAYNEFSSALLMDQLPVVL